MLQQTLLYLYIDTFRVRCHSGKCLLSSRWRYIYQSSKLKLTGSVSTHRQLLSQILWSGGGYHPKQIDNKLSDYADKSIPEKDSETYPSDVNAVSDHMISNLRIITDYVIKSKPISTNNNLHLLIIYVSVPLVIHLHQFQSNTLKWSF